MARKKRPDNFHESLSLARPLPSRILAPTTTSTLLATKRVVSAVVGILALGLFVSALVPTLTPTGRIWGLFETNTSHNLAHLLFGSLALYAAINLDMARPIWRSATVFFGLMTILGLVVGDGHILGLIANNGYDTGLHLAKTLAFAWLGWGGREPAAGRLGRG